MIVEEPQPNSRQSMVGREKEVSIRCSCFRLLVNLFVGSFNDSIRCTHHEAQPRRKTLKYQPVRMLPNLLMVMQIEKIEKVDDQ